MVTVPVQHDKINGCTHYRSPGWPLSKSHSSEGSWLFLKMPENHHIKLWVESALLTHLGANCFALWKTDQYDIW